jgi:branched-chain amino acid transport system substrate-binding protein
VIQAYFDQVNKAGGVNGRKLNWSPRRRLRNRAHVANTKSLINEKKVFALLALLRLQPDHRSHEQGLRPGQGAAGRHHFRRRHAARADFGQPERRYMFNVRASYADETEAIVNQMVSLGLKNIAVFYQNDGFGKSGLEGVTAALKKHNLAPIAVGTVERNSLDVAKAVESISKATPQAVVMVTLYKPTAAFVKAMKKSGQNPDVHDPVAGRRRATGPGTGPRRPRHRHLAGRALPVERHVGVVATTRSWSASKKARLLLLRPRGLHHGRVMVEG